MCVHVSLPFGRLEKNVNVLRYMREHAMRKSSNREKLLRHDDKSGQLLMVPLTTNAFANENMHVIGSASLILAIA